MPEPDQITDLLASARQGNQAAQNTLYEIVYIQIRQRAHAMLRGELQAYAISSGTLVHEAFAKLFQGGSSLNVQERSQFYLLAARAMRQVIVEHVRKGNTTGRAGGAVSRDKPNFADTARLPTIDDVIAVSEVCEKLAASKPFWAQVMDLHFFGGFRVIEIAEILGLSEATVDNRLNLAKAFLHREMTTGGASAANAGG